MCRKMCILCQQTSPKRGLETGLWRQIVTSQSAHTKYKWLPCATECIPHENLLRTPLLELIAKAQLQVVTKNQLTLRFSNRGQKCFKSLVLSTSIFFTAPKESVMTFCGVNHAKILLSVPGWGQIWPVGVLDTKIVEQCLRRVKQDFSNCGS